MTALNASMQSAALTNSAKVNGANFARMHKQALQMQQGYADALSSTGLFDVATRKIKNHTDEWVKSVQRQRLSLRDLRKDWDSYGQAFNHQLQLQRMSIKSFATDKMGNPLVTWTVPKGTITDVARLGDKLAFAGHVTESIATNMINVGKNIQWAGRQLAMGFTTPLVAAGAISAKFAYDMDKELTQTAKVYDTYATTQAGKEKELLDLRKDQIELAREAAKAYGTAGKETLNMSAQLASAGERGENLLAATKEAARFASLGDFSGDASVKTLRSLRSVFKMTDEELTKSVDYMNAIENATSLTMEDMANAIPTAAGAMAQLNGTLEDTITLLVAMKQQGFDPGESANAIKAAGSRLIRPSKKVQEEFMGLTGVSIMDIRENNQGNVVGMLTDIAKATQDLSDTQRAQALVALFGAEQSQRLMASMNGLIDAQNGVGETARAMEVSQKSASENAAAAAEELERQAESLSGRITRQFETLKVNLFEFGELFLDVAAKLLGGVNAIVNWINKLPNSVKHILGWGAALVAAAGPILMLIGLSKNLFGQMLNIAAMILKRMNPAFELFSAEERAAGMVADWTTKRLQNQRSATLSLTEAVKAHTNALMAQNAAAGVTTKGPHHSTAQNRIPKGQPGAGRFAPVPPPTTQEKMASKAGAGWKMNTASAALFAASLAATQVSSNQIVSNVAQWGMTLGAIVPILGSIGGRFGALTKLSAALLTPWGLFATGTVVAIGVGIKAWIGHMKKVRQEIRDSINDGEKLARILDLGEKQQRVVPGAPIENESAWRQQQRKEEERRKKEIDDAAKFKEEYGRLTRDITKLYETNTKESIKNAELMVQQKAIEVFDYGGTVEDAERAMKMALMAAGKTASQADQIILRVGVPEDLGDILKVQMDEIKAYSEVVFGQLPGWMSGGTEFEARMTKIGTNIGSILYSVRNEFDDTARDAMKVAEEAFSKLQEGLAPTDAYYNMYKDKDREKIFSDVLSQMGYEGEALEEATKRVVEYVKEYKKEVLSIQELYSVLDIEQPLVASLDQVFGSTAKKIDEQGLARLEEAYARAAAMTVGDQFEQQAAGIAAFREEMDKMGIEFSPQVNALIEFGAAASDATEEVLFLNRAFSGLDGSIMAAVLGKARIDMADTERKAKEFRDAMEDALASARSSATSSFAARVTKSMDAAHKKRLDAIANASQAAMDRAANAMEARHKRQQQALDDRWKKRKRALQEEEDLRKKIFNAEIQRIQRMKEINNDNVDYRVAVNTGNLDEAAKIRNEISAKQSTWALEDSDKQQEERFAKAMQKLEDQEAAQRRHLEKVQALEKKAMEARRKAAAESVRIAQEAEEKKYQAQKEAVEKGLKFIQDSNPANKQHLEQLIKTAKERYGIMGNDLDIAAKKWAQDFGDNLSTAAISASKTIMGFDFTAQGKKFADDFARAISGGSISTGDLVNYMKTGKLKTSKYDPDVWNHRGRQVKHSGGLIAGGHSGVGDRVGELSGSRAGYSRSSRVMPSEQLLLAKRGEYVMSKKTVDRLGVREMDAINAVGRHSGGYVGLGSAPRSAWSRDSTELIMKSALTTAHNAYKKDLEAEKERLAEELAGAISGVSGSLGKVDPSGWNKPWAGSYGTRNGHDYPLSYKKIYAPHSGTVTAHAIRGHEPRVGHGGRGFRSYGQYVTFRGGGTSMMFAHLSKLPIAAGKSKRVSAGQAIGVTGETGNAHGPHVHVELPSGSGNSHRFGAFFRARGIKLKTGGKIRYDDTPALLHKDERVLAAPQTRKLEEGIDRFANGSGPGYNGLTIENININGEGWSPQDIPKLAREIKKEFEKDDARFSRDR